MIAPTPRDTVLVDGPSQLFRFRPDPAATPAKAPPVLLVPSMINRWYVLDLRTGASVAEALVKAGLDVWCLDWGVPREEDREFTWADAVARLSRMLKRVRRETKAQGVTVLGYCMGATLASVHASLEPELYSGFINLLGPIDFTHAGHLGLMADKRWFDADAVADAGNVAPHQMQSAFTLLRPTQLVGKWVGVADRAHDPAFRTAFQAMETWANDNVAFPAAAYRTYISELYQQNQLVEGRHSVGGRPVRLSEIKCPVLTIAADKDTICPSAAAVALNEKVGARKQRILKVPGGHVGAVVGSKAASALYPALIEFMKETPCS